MATLLELIRQARQQQSGTTGTVSTAGGATTAPDSFSTLEGMAKGGKGDDLQIHRDWTNMLWNDSTGGTNSRFAPIEQAVWAQGRPTEAMRGLDRMSAVNRANQASNLALGTSQRQIRATGIKLDPGETAALQRRQGIQRVLNRVDGANMADRAFDNRREMVRNFAFDAEGDALQTANAALSKSSEDAQNRKDTTRAEQAGKRAGWISLAGTVAGAAIAFSSSTLKENREPVSILDGLKQLDIEKWNYIGEDEKHVGPMAEDFQRIFGVGDGYTLKLVDVMGVMLGAIKEMAVKAQKE